MTTIQHSHTFINLKQFYQDRRVFITGHTGFKGSWLCLWLHAMGATVTGYALSPPTEPSLYELCRIDELVNTIIADVRDANTLVRAMAEVEPEIVIHMAAQPLVGDSYKNPMETFAINVMGTVHLLEAVRACKSVKAVINVTTDKVYENREWVWGYRENEPLGGYDPYSCSKACSELITAAYHRSFFNHSPAIATARAGNVIGGGDWGQDRLIPDCIRAFLKDKPVHLRNPYAIRPWQHVLEPLFGYLLLAQRLVEDGPRFAGAWNFGPCDQDAKNVECVVATLCEKWGNDVSYIIDAGDHPHEATCLKLDSSKAMALLDWRPEWDFNTAIKAIVSWTKAYQNGLDVRQVCREQIRDYVSTRFFVG